MPSIFAHSITGKPYSSLPTDLWIEMKMNKGPKMKAGWQRILGNEAMLCANIKSRNYINQVRVKLHYIADIKSYKSGHKENTASRIKLDELGVEDACIVDFNCDPFDPENVQLSSLQSGQLVSKEVEDDLLSAYEDGETKVKEFFEKRIFTRIKKWGISKCNRKIFLNDNNDKKVSVAKCKTAQMESDAMSRVISEYCGTDVTLIDILENRVTDECLAVFNTNETMDKTQKSQLLQSFVFAPLDFIGLQNYIAAVDMGFFWRLCMPTAEDREKGDETKYTWADYANKIFFTIMNLHLNAKTVLFVNNSFDVNNSVKSEEDVGRNCIYGSKNVYIKAID